MTSPSEALNKLAATPMSDNSALLADDSGAVMSDDRVYRYALWRIWNRKAPLVMFIGLNPSTADEQQDDPTIRRIKGFADGFGYGGVIMTNLFAFRATKPTDMIAADDPIGVYNNLWILELAARCASVCCAWGANKGTESQRYAVVKMMSSMKIDMWCLGKTKEGHPRHPLYVKGDKTAEPFDS